MKKEKKAISPQEAAELYSLSVGTLANLRCKKQGPKYYCVGRKVLYFVDDLEAWIKRNLVLTMDSLSEESRWGRS